MEIKVDVDITHLYIVKHGQVTHGMGINTANFAELWKRLFYNKQSKSLVLFVAQRN